jgi:outer membrane receptor protein involved in Fe transport
VVTDRWRSERVRHLVAARSLADRAGATLESVTVEQAAPLGATDVTERVEEAVRQTAERRDVDARDLSQALSILLRAIERAVQRLDDNPTSSCHPMSCTPWKPSSASTGPGRAC